MVLHERTSADLSCFPCRSSSSHETPPIILPSAEKNIPPSMLSIRLSASLNRWKQLESECLVIIHPDDPPGTWHTLGTWKKFVDLK